MEHILLYIVRHGDTDYNDKNLFLGDLDIPMNDDGRKMVDEAVEYLKGLDLQPNFIISSDRLRALETVEKLLEIYDAPTHETPHLRPWDKGEFVGKPRTDENKLELQKYFDDPYLTIPGGESEKAFIERSLPAIEECFQLAITRGMGIVVTHSSVIHEIGIMLDGDRDAIMVEPGGVIIIGIDNGHSIAKPLFKPMLAKPEVKNTKGTVGAETSF